MRTQHGALPPEPQGRQAAALHDGAGRAGQTLPQGGTARHELVGGRDVLVLGGDWTLAHYAALSAQVAQLRVTARPGIPVELSELARVDTAGAALLHELLGAEGLADLYAPDGPLDSERAALLRTVATALQSEARPGAEPVPAIIEVLEHVGKAMGAFADHLVGLAGFIGLTLQTGLTMLVQPRRWRFTALVAHLEQTGFHAVPIVALLTFLVGAVVAFLGATVLTTFGASIFTVDLVAYSFLREFGVLLAAIIVAGRTASSFTAQIGSMRANEEVDAIRVLGLDPVELLVLPRVSALLLALPLLTFVAMVSGIVGGMLVCLAKLDISITMFLSVIDNNIDVKHFYIGMAKAPIFAFLIGVVGCLEGFRVSGSAQSVGEHTTSAVVQSIFIVIVVDAVAALFCMEMGW